MNAAALIALLALQGAPAGAPATTPPAGAAGPGAATPASGAPAPHPATGAGAHGDDANPDRGGRAALRESAEREMLAELVPPPLLPEEIRTMAQRLGAGKDAETAVDAIVSTYERATADAYTRATTAVRARLGSAYEGGGTTGNLEPAAGPELVAVLQSSAAWRETLASADADLLRRLAPLRTGSGTVTPVVLGFERVRDRDDLPTIDPAAGIRLSDLLDESGLAGAERVAVETQLERAWSRAATAIAARRRELGAVALERARLLAEWGPAWEVSAAPALREQRSRALETLAARERASEAELAAASREGVAALLRALPQEASARIRSSVDELLWPWLFTLERQLEAAVARARAMAEPALAEPLAALELDLTRRLEGTRRELSKRAGAAGSLDDLVAQTQLGAEPEQLVGALQSQLALLELLGKRRTLVRSFALQMKQAAGADPRVMPIFDERLAAIDADARTADWRRRGIEARLQEIGAGAHLPPAPGEEGEGAPAGGDAAPGARP
ncbi:MAG: hypothetical protein U0625_02520 [Phycisphaerales bacterium]